MTRPDHMTFGVFMAPFHRIGENPTLALERDLELLEVLDRLGLEEAWIGEHHSAGWEIIGSPEVFLAAAAARTSRLRLGTGVVSLPYHNPLMVADRILLLDHLSHGRAMLGVGPGALPSDAAMLGIEATRQRDMMDEALGVVLALLRGESVTHTAEWFSLHEAQCQLRPFAGELPVAVASMFTPSGMKVAGKHGAAVLSLGVFVPGVLTDMAGQWEIAELYAEEHGNTLDRSEWRLSIPVHLSETREQAVEEVRYRFGAWLTQYFGEAIGRPLPLPEGFDPDQLVDFMVMAGGGIIGTPDDAIEAIEKMQDLSGGFGGLLCLAHEWAPTASIHRSYELLARYVVPHFQGSAAGLESSLARVRAHREEYLERTEQAFEQATRDHEEHLARRGEP